MGIQVSGCLNITYGKILPDVQMEMLAGSPDAENTFANPQSIASVK